MTDVVFNADLIILLDGKNTYKDVETLLAERLVQLGYAKDSFPKAIVSREENFPTALDVGGYNAAIPHCDVDNVVTPAICVGILQEPVEWRRMDDPDEMCGVSLVVMLALTEPHSHIGMLQQVVALIQDQELIGRVVLVKSANEAFSLLASRLNA